MMVLLIVLAIPLFATPVQDNTGTNYLRISINFKGEVVVQDVSAPFYEILAVKPAEIKQSWLPTQSYKTGNFTNTIKCKNQRVNIKNNIRRRIRSPA